MAKIPFTSSPEQFSAENLQDVPKAQERVKNAVDRLAWAFYQQYPEEFGISSIVPASREVRDYAAKVAAQPEVPTSQLSAAEQAVINAYGPERDR